MKRFIKPVTGAALLGLLGLGLQAQAAITNTVISGSMGKTQDTCLQGLTNAVGNGENCMYDGGPASAAGYAPLGTDVTGPYNHIAYYDSLATPAAFTATTNGDGSRTLYAPTVGDGKINQAINGSVSINDNGDGFGANDLLSFTMTLTSPGGGAIVRTYGSSVIDKYDSMTQVLAPVAASFVTGNGFGGFDYIIGSEGFPSLLTYSQAGPCFGVAFGDVECGHSFPTTIDFWNGTTTAGLGSLESSFGAKTAGTVVGLACIDSKGAGAVGVGESNDCRDSQVSYAPYLGANGTCLATGGCVVGGIRGSAEDVSWDQMLLRVSTDALGNVVSLAGFNVDDYRVFGTTRCGDNTAGSGTHSATCNSWTSGYFTAAAAVVPVPAAAWLFGSALGLLGWARRRAHKA